MIEFTLYLTLALLCAFTSGVIAGRATLEPVRPWRESRLVALTRTKPARNVAIPAAWRVRR